ncbi:MAG: PilW family protein [Candidatus Scalinduaceae bacterium]
MDSLHKNNERGFTIMELIVSVAIGMVILVVSLSMFYVQRKTFIAQEQLSEVQQNVRAAMDIIKREVKMAGYDPTGAGFDGIGTSTTQLQTLADLDGDGLTTASNEDIIYSHDIPNLRIDRNTQPFTENIQAFNFDYLDATGTTTTTPADIRQVRITITGRTAKVDPGYPDNGGYRTYTLNSLVTPKNLDY